MTAILSKGTRCQLDLYRWFRTTVQTSTPNYSEGNPTQARFISAVRAAKEALNSGWSLTMSAANSPADKAGVDFVWSHQRYGVWFPIDTSFKDKVGVPSLIHLAKLVEDTDCVTPRLSFESKVVFLELLVELSGTSPMLYFSELPLPEMGAVANLRKSLESFQAQLAKIGSKPASAPFAEWAHYLNGAIGYQGRADKGQYFIDSSLIDYAIGEAVSAFLCARRGGCPDFDRGPFQRGKHISYSEQHDTLQVPDPKTPIWAGIKTRVQHHFDKEYALLVKLEGAHQLLLLTKQMFSAQGVNWAIHHILDVVEAKTSGRSINVRPKMKAQELTIVPVVPVRRKTANEALFAPFASQFQASARIARAGSA